MTDVFTKRAIGHDEARECARRFINGHFNNPGRERPRASIPARPDYDDDLLLLSYIKQQEASPAPPPIQDHRWEVVKAVQKALPIWWRRGAAQNDMEIRDCGVIADAAISTLLALGWKPGKEEG